MRIKIESQLEGQPNEGMKMSSVTSFGASGGHIFDVVAPELKKHVFRAILAQHVASELRSHLWTSSSRTNRNTPSRLKIDFLSDVIKKLMSYNGYNI